MIANTNILKELFDSSLIIKYLELYYFIRNLPHEEISQFSFHSKQFPDRRKSYLICSNVRNSVQKLIHQHLILIYENSNMNFSNLKCKSKIVMESLCLITISCKSMEIPLHTEYWSSPFAILCRILIRAVVIALTVNYFSCCFFDTFCVKGKAIVSTNDKCPNWGTWLLPFSISSEFPSFPSHQPFSVGFFFLGGGGGVAVFEIMYNLILKSNNILIHAYGIKIQKWINTYVSILYCYSFTDVWYMMYLFPLRLRLVRSPVYPLLFV